MATLTNTKVDKRSLQVAAEWPIVLPHGNIFIKKVKGQVPGNCGDT